MSAHTDEFVLRLLSGDSRALGRALSILERGGDDAVELQRSLSAHCRGCLTIGVTGPPGVGKSTLVSALIRQFRARDLSVGVVAVDPSSPLTGGALLGDRLRMSEHAGDPGVFVRSVASRGHLGGLSIAALRMIDALDAAGRNLVVLETVGAGQSEVEVANVADVTVVVCAPGAGDEVQALKAGILEIADILVVNKADHPLAERTASQLRAAISVRDAPSSKVPVFSTVATDARGVLALADDLLAALAVHGNPLDRRRRRARSAIAHFAADELRRSSLARQDERLSDLCEAVLEGRLGFEDAAREWLRSLRPGP